MASKTLRNEVAKYIHAVTISLLLRAVFRRQLTLNKTLVVYLSSEDRTKHETDSNDINIFREFIA